MKPEIGSTPNETKLFQCKSRTCALYELNTHICYNLLLLIPCRCAKTSTTKPIEHTHSLTHKKKKHSLFILGFRSLLFAVFDRVAGFFPAAFCCSGSHFGSKNQKLNARVIFGASNFFPCSLLFFLLVFFVDSFSTILSDLAAFKWTIDENILHIIISYVCVCVCLHMCLAFGSYRTCKFFTYSTLRWLNID